MLRYSRPQHNGEHGQNAGREDGNETGKKGEPERRKFHEAHKAFLKMASIASRRVMPTARVTSALPL